MNKIILIFFLLLVLSVKGQTNIYHPFPDSNAVWTENYGSGVSCMDGNYCVDADNFSYIIDGDTLINSLTYHKIYIPVIQDKYYNINCGGCLSFWRSIKYNGCIRQDTSLRKVWYINAYFQNEILLYNFNAIVGDTITMGTGNNCTPHVVTSIDSILVGAGYRKCWYTDSYFAFPETIIEGIGSNVGLLEAGCYHYLDGCYCSFNGYLTCFKQNGTVLYPDTATTCGVVSIKNISQQNFFVKLSPNPFHTTAILEVEGAELHTYQLKIYDLMGKIVQQQTINKQPEIINRNNLQDGFYLYHIILNDAIIANGKLILD